MISVIVPVYNVDKFIKRCINSVIEQTYTEWELILIDDGSTDLSGLICDEFAKNHFQIKCFHQKNSGVSVARNLGIQKAKGEYLIFIDSDDWINKNTLEVIHSYMRSSEVDLLVYGMKTFYSKGKVEYASYEDELLDKSELLERYMQINIGDGPCNKVFARNIIDKNEIEFPKGIPMGEDARFVIEYVKLINTARLIPDVLYNYERRSLSSTTKSYHKGLDRYLFEILELKKRLFEEYNTLNKNNLMGLQNRAEEWLLLSLERYVCTISNKKQLNNEISGLYDTLITYIDFNSLQNTKLVPYKEVLASRNIDKLIECWKTNNWSLYIREKVKQLLFKSSFAKQILQIRINYINRFRETDDE